MANVLYPKFKEHILKADIDFDSITVKAALIDTGTYTYNAAHEFHSDLSGIVGTPTAVGSVTVTDGVIDGADVTFSSVSGATVEAVVLYNDTGVSGTSHLIAYLDTGTGLPITPNGGDLQLTWSNGASKIVAV